MGTPKGHFGWWLSVFRLLLNVNHRPCVQCSKLKRYSNTITICKTNFIQPYLLFLIGVQQVNLLVVRASLDICLIKCCIFETTAYPLKILNTLSNYTTLDQVWQNIDLKHNTRVKTLQLFKIQTKSCRVWNQWSFINTCLIFEAHQ